MRFVLRKLSFKNLKRFPVWSSTNIGSNVHPNDLCRAGFQWTFQKQKHIRFMSTLKQSIIMDLSQDIDIESIKLKRQQLLRQGQRASIHKMVKEELERKCSQFLDSLNLNPQQSKLLQIVQLEHSHLASEGNAVLPPEKMTNQNWVEALTCSSAEERFTYFLFVAHKHKLTSKTRKAEMENKRRWEEDGMKEGENKHGIIYAHESRLPVGKLGDHRLSSSMMFGLPLVIDMDFENTMTSKEIGETAKQLWRTYSINKKHAQPFHLIFTGCPSTNSIYRSLELRHLLDCDHFLASTFSQNYLELYDPSDIVYLTPHAKHTVKEFDPKCVYVMAAYCDMMSKKRMAIAKASRQKIKCQRLPIDEYIKWSQGNKDLFLHVVLQILLEKKDNRTWKDAFISALPTKCYQQS